MKKFLSLVLALVMTMSLVTVSAGAKDYADAEDITYTEAVDVLSALGVLEGDETGFRPNDTLKRSEAAKIICALNLTPDTAAALSADTAPFADVPTSHWAAGYIAEGVQSGIIAGVGGNKYDPDGQLTGYAFLKMLLVSLGYDAAIEGLTGANWTVNVLKLADDLELTDGNDDFIGSKAVTREEAALYALNALQTTMVDYNDKGTQITINGAVIATGASKASAVYGTKDQYQNISSASAVVDGVTKYTVEFGEKVFSKLELTSDGDVGDFGRPTNTWKYKSKKVGSYGAKDPILTYTAGVKEKALFSDLGVDGYDTDGTAKYVNLTVYVDGVPQADIKAHKGQDVTIANTGNGVTTEIYKTNVDNEYVMVVINEYITKISSITKADEDQGEKRKINTGMGSFETEEFAKGDWVLVTIEKSDSENEVIKSAALAEVIEDAVVNSYKTDKNVTADGTTYKFSKKYVGVNKDDYNMEEGNSYTFYLDSCGNVIKDEVYTATNTDYSLVLQKIGNKTDDFSTDVYSKYQVVNAEGVVSTIKAYDENGTAVKGDIITYTEDKDNDGYVKVKKVSDEYDADKAYKDDSEAVDVLSSTKASVGGIKVNNTTTFVLRTGDNKWKVVEGLSSLNKYTFDDGDEPTATAVVKKGVAVVLFVDVRDAASSTVDAADLVYIVNTTPVKSYDADNEYYVYTYAAVKDGEDTTITADDDDVVTGKGLYEITSTSDGYVSKLVAKTADGYAVETVTAQKVEFEDGVLSITTGGSYVVADDAEVTVIDKNDNVTLDAEIDAVLGDKATGTYTFVMKSETNDTVVAIYFQGTIK